MESAKYIYESSREFFKRINESYNWYTVPIPIINVISGIPVDVELSIQKINMDDIISHYGIIIINSSKIFNYNDKSIRLYYHRKRLTKHTPKYINKFLIEFNELLPKLKLNKLFGEFQIENGKKINLRNLGIDIFNCNYSNSMDCVVCYDKTYTKTCCNHYLCLECWSQIKNEHCPICRNHLHIHDDESECDSDDNSDY